MGFFDSYDEEEKIKRRKEIEDEMDELWLDEDEKEEVRSGDYSPEDFGEEDLEEDDYYYEDDN